jgi:hypothetical protein
LKQALATITGIRSRITKGSSPHLLIAGFTFGIIIAHLRHKVNF